MTNAFQYVAFNGILTSSAYPYTGMQGACKTFAGTFKISGHANVVANCNSVAAAVLTRPITVGVDATNWFPYKSGIFTNCSYALNHGVLLVGVTDKIWKIKNSWGSGWGEGGYIRLNATNGNDTCGVCRVASYPLK